MFRNYLTTAWKVLLRRKFFSFVNLFGIAITLAVITVVLALVENWVKPLGAESNSWRYLVVSDVVLTNEERSSTWSWNAGYRFLERHVLNLETPDLIGFRHEPEEGTVWVDGRKVSPQVVYTDGGFWQIMTYDFLEGRGLAADDVDSGRHVAVINAAMREQIFGGEPAAGKRFVLNGAPYQVVGVVANEPEMRSQAFGEVWIPYTTMPASGWRQQWIGGFSALLYAEDPDRLPLVQQEFLDGLKTFEHDDPDELSVAYSAANDQFEALAEEFIPARFEAMQESQSAQFVGFLVAGMIAFMFLPVINLVNLNVSRILERSGEIGVRKAFGASVRTLIGQFLVESVVLAVFGGILGFGLGLVALELIEASGTMAYAELHVDIYVFLAAFAMMLVFGVLSGLYPAWKMARMHPVAALKRA